MGAPTNDQVTSNGCTLPHRLPQHKHKIKKKYFDLIVDFPLSFFLYLAARASSQEAKNTKTDTEK